MFTPLGGNFHLGLLIHQPQGVQTHDTLNCSLNSHLPLQQHEKKENTTKGKQKIDAQSWNNEEAQLMNNYLKHFFFYNSTVRQDIKSQLCLGEHKPL